ncbi:heme ABC exporter ATP-binding protein CcmA [Chachezhania sediminis]|uniref:heme ABC exporter ATP-binding protein CcmA n=1 Tax=Chachezhania sediminis TaxID=2599291 RepID=UPI00131C3B0D|nr:heme ABC exporter ATP-binding protein CcmA [Chachezhania sediminis]
MTLTVTDLTVARGGLPVLEGLTFAVPAGQALILRGPNGIGKTTLLRTLAGLQPPVKGTVEGGGDRVAYAAHADGIKATLTVAENLTFWARIFGQTGIEGALSAYELEPLADRPAGGLSAGQKRRLGLARMLVTGRPVWVMDEPTVSLDVSAVQMFADAIRAHLARGGSAVIATHIELGLDGAVLDAAAHRARLPDLTADGFDEAFL